VNELQQKNKKSATIILLIVVAMIGLSFAAVPLYSMFCRKTGFAGTPLISSTLPDHVLKRRITVSFYTRVDNSLPWEFKADKSDVKLAVGQQGMMSFTASNLSANETTGTAIYNVTPDKVAKYFHKTQCFCFGAQNIGPGKTAQLPVVFFVDPSIANDAEMDDITDIALSYTFFAANSKALDKAISTYGQKK
jgi:cytochrome c oxidase assembly protein subunit 11